MPKMAAMMILKPKFWRENVIPDFHLTSLSSNEYKHLWKKYLISSIISQNILDSLLETKILKNF